MASFSSDGSDFEVDKNYAVERIDDKVKSDKLKRRLKWRGFDQVKNAWLPVENLDDVSDKKDAFKINEADKVDADEEEKENIDEDDEDDWLRRQYLPRSVDIFQNELFDQVRSELFDENEVEVTPPAREADGSGQETSLLQFRMSMAFDQRLNAAEILGATNTYVPGELMFLIKWENDDTPSLIPNAEVIKHIPHMLIEFYEKHLSWLSV